MIQLQGLTISYGEKTLAYPELSIKKGEAVGLAGKSGCGKTSLFSLLLGELPPGCYSYEKAELLGRDLSLWGPERFEKISYVPQFAQNALNPRMRVRDHVDAVLSACGRRDEGEAEELFSSLSLSEELFSRYPKTLSGGQKQRVVLALAMLKRPELLLMDEPSSAIDLITLQKILEYLLSIKGTVTILMTAHQRPFLRKAADRVVELL